MKNLLLGPCMVLFSSFAMAQVHPEGKVVDDATGQGLGGVSVESRAFGNSVSNDSGFFSFAQGKSGVYRLRLSYIGYQGCDTTILLSSASPALIRLRRIDLFLQPIEVRPLRAGEKAPFSKTNLSKKEIERSNLGQDLPFLLNQTPSVVINSDAGNGVGYTGIYIRGSDATRINMTLNGIPYNDAESQGIYFVDLPDFASSVNSIQIQRGVGTSSNGAGAFGASINFSTNEFNEKPYAEFNNSYGSFNTWKNTIKAGSGLIDGHFTIDARLSRITSDGYIDRATSDLKSFFLTAAYFSKRSSIRLNILSGTEKTYQAWNGIPQAKLYGDRAALDLHYQNNKGSLYFTPEDSLNLYNSNNRTYNYFTYQNQTDNYQQDHYQLFYNQQLSDRLSMNLAGFLTRGRGYYEEYKPQQTYASYGLSGPIIGSDTLSSTDLIRQRWLDNYFFGAIYSLQYKSAQTEASLGGGWDRYDGKHYGSVIWSQNGGIPPDYPFYHEPAYKTDFNIYGKLQQRLSDHWFAFADLQFRLLHYQINGFDDNPALHINQHYQFINPKAGISYSNEGWEAYLSYSKGSHEPSHDDFEANPNQQPRPEILHDFELSLEKKAVQYGWSATGYYMLYHDQLALTGKINDVGSYTRTNIPSSYRLGIELTGYAKPLAWLGAEGNLAFSRNKVRDYTEFVDNYDNGSQQSFHYQNPDIAFSPAVVGAASLNFLPQRDLECSLIGKYVSREYLDNAQKTSRMLGGYYVQQFRAIYTLKTKNSGETHFIFQINNLFNQKYEPNGYTYSYILNSQLTTENFYFPMAGINWMLAVNIRL